MKLRKERREQTSEIGKLSVEYIEKNTSFVEMVFPFPFLFIFVNQGAESLDERSILTAPQRCFIVPARSS